ncbi:DUF1653 domain-containing protein [Anaerocolumna sp. AGMB13020]|uniref:DUF1653 domain-containing protein n=1 Tax=Anaerocolumna sp. AGMB13020 TaxID=3081750 RepID=UPI002952B3C0|nr:DUF1653 domain-containing protein [Anaerocolumna sp. AGMB13020]WOO36266.1 DUF1653 domain-containing protein [Anaerocolumna sp. AGMB13020]
MSITGIYRHFKGNYYEVLGEAINDSKETLVFYRQMYEPFGFWLRPKDMFFEKKDTEQGKVERFIKIGESSENIMGKIDVRSLRIRHSEKEEIYQIRSWKEEDGSFEVSKIE